MVLSPDKNKFGTIKMPVLAANAFALYNINDGLIPLDNQV